MNERPRRTDQLLTADELELLDILIEECAEVIKAATKMKRFGRVASFGGVDYDNVRDLGLELGDLRCMSGKAVEHGLARSAEILEGEGIKMMKLPVFTRNLS